MNTPVLLVIFNRLDTTEKVFESIRQAQPKQLFIAADGPRLHKEDDIEKCMKARSIIEKIDWDCEVKTLFQDKNLGCHKGMITAVNWFFENIEEGIILEDDIVPNQSFFSFCAELLEKYRYDDRIMHIAGDNCLDDINIEDSYYFSNIMFCWGWASWRRAWKHFDFEMKTFPKFKNTNRIKDVITNDPYGIFSKYIINETNSICNGTLDAWSYKWNYIIMSQGGLCIHPKANLISSIGGGGDSTHIVENEPSLNRVTQEIDEIIHPEFILVNQDIQYKIFADRMNLKQFFPPEKTFKYKINRNSLRIMQQFLNIIRFKKFNLLE